MVRNYACTGIRKRQGKTGGIGIIAPEVRMSRFLLNQLCYNYLDYDRYQAVSPRQDSRHAGSRQQIERGYPEAAAGRDEHRAAESELWHIGRAQADYRRRARRQPPAQA